MLVQGAYIVECFIEVIQDRDVTSKYRPFRAFYAQKVRFDSKK